MPKTKEPETTTTVFRSRDKQLRIVRKPERRRYNEAGELELIPGQRVEFTRGAFQTEDDELIEWLRNHPRFNSRFWEVGNEPDRQKPTVDEAMTEIAKAAAKAEPDALAAIYEREVNTYDRQPVKDAATAALEALEEASADKVEDKPEE